MPSKTIAQQLKKLVKTNDFESDANELTERWTEEGVGLDAVEPILRFMEQHPAIDYGMPGPLAHFLETFYKQGYEELLLASLQRKPMAITVWMLHRILNGTKNKKLRAQYTALLRESYDHPKADAETKQSLQMFFEDLG